jgi:hypothetical protein
MSTKLVRTAADLVRFNCGLDIECGGCGHARTMVGFEGLDLVETYAELLVTRAVIYLGPMRQERAKALLQKVRLGAYGSRHAWQFRPMHEPGQRHRAGGYRQVKKHPLAGGMVIVCKIFGHRRSRKLAGRSGETWDSKCCSCGAKMTRVAPGDWVALP